MAEEKKVTDLQENPFNKEMKSRHDFYDEMKRLLERHPDKFVVSVGENDYYSGMVDLFSLAETSKGIFLLHLALDKERRPERDVVEVLMLAQSEGRKTIYRLDIKAGDETRKEFEKMVNGLDGIHNIKDKQLFSGYVYSRFVNINGLITTFDSNWAETEIKDSEALEILRSVTSVKIPQDLSYLPTWDEFLARDRKLNEGLKELP